MNEWSGYYEYVLNPAPKGVLLSFKQPGTGTWLGYADNIRHDTDTAYLMWKWTGIGREQMQNKC